MPSSDTRNAPRHSSPNDCAAHPRQSVAVLGAGTWGAVLAQVISPLAQVRLWSATGAHLSELSTRRTHPHLPGLVLDPGIEVTDDIARALEAAGVVVLAVASRYARSVIRKAAPHLEDDALLVIASKGMEVETGRTLSEVICEELGARRLVAASGGSHAEEVVHGLPFGMTLAGDRGGCRRVRDLLSRTRGRFSYCSSIRGIEIAASLKNVVAVVAGIADGLQLGDNFRACYLVDALEEMGRFAARASGAALDPLQYGVFGDLLATALSRHSRNFRYGRLLGQGVQAPEASARIGMVVEGLYTARSLATQDLADFPILRASAAVVREERPFTAAELIARLGY